MNKISKWFLLISFLIVNSAYAQDYDKDYSDETDSSRFQFGLNFGAHFANNNTAIIYTGSSDITQFGIEFILDQPFNRQEFVDFFQYEFYVAEYPFNPTYRTASEMGFHMLYRFGKNWANALFLDFNISQLKFEQTFTIAIEDPTNQIPGPTFQQFPIFGRENRFILNLGTQFSFYHDEASNAYFSFFGNLTNVQMRRNYIVINNREYEIFHINAERPSERLGGMGYGGGGGLGFKFRLSEEIITDLYYNLYYSQINFKEELNPYGIHHSLGLRFIWGKISVE